MTAIVLAAGAGRRMGGLRGEKGEGAGAEKIFATLAGRPLLYYSLKALETSPEIERVVIVARKRSLQRCCNLIARYGFRKVQTVAAGGRRRQDSLEKGMCFARGAKYVLVHDGARPLLDRSLISRTVAASRRTGAAIPALRATDSLKRVKAGRIEETVPRQDVWCSQTPQVFRRSILEEALRRWPHKSTATDDAAMVTRIGRKVTVVEGDPLNIKITFSHDLSFAEFLLRHRGKHKQPK